MLVLRFYDLNCDWLRISTSRTSFSQTLFFGGEKQQPEIRLCLQANFTLYGNDLTCSDCRFDSVISVYAQVIALGE